MASSWASVDLSLSLRPRLACVNPGFLLFFNGEKSRPPAQGRWAGERKRNENQARRFRAVKVAAPAVATKVAAMSTSDPKPVLANSERFGE